MTKVLVKNLELDPNLFIGILFSASGASIKFRSWRKLDHTDGPWIEFEVESFAPDPQPAVADDHEHT